MPCQLTALLRDEDTGCLRETKRQSVQRSHCEKRKGFRLHELARPAEGIGRLNAAIYPLGKRLHQRRIVRAPTRHHPLLRR